MYIYLRLFKDAGAHLIWKIDVRGSVSHIDYDILASGRKAVAPDLTYNIYIYIYINILRFQIGPFITKIPI